MDDGVREVRGVRVKEGNDGRPKTVRETDTNIIIDGPVEIRLSVASARHLAKQLYRLAGRLERRLAAKANTPSNEAEHPAPATASVATPSIDAADIEGSPE